MMKSFQIFWVLFKILLEIIWCIIKMMYKNILKNERMKKDA